MLCHPHYLVKNLITTILIFILTGKLLHFTDLQVSPKAKKDGPVVVGLSPASTSLGSSKVQGKLNSPSELIEDAAPVKPQVAVQSAISRGRPGSSTSSTSECGGAAPSASSGPGVSRSSSVGSLSSEKSTLNPHAKVQCILLVCILLIKEPLVPNQVCTRAHGLQFLGVKCTLHGSVGSPVNQVLTDSFLIDVAVCSC